MILWPRLKLQPLPSGVLVFSISFLLALVAEAALPPKPEPLSFKDQWYDQGYAFDALYSLESSRTLFGANGGGVSLLHNLELNLTLDGEKVFKMPRTKFFIQWLGNMGSESGNRPTVFVNGAQGISNIEARADDLKFFELSMQKTFADERSSVLFGLHNLNSEFYVTPSSSLFLNTSFGVGKELSQTGGLGGPSIFPLTSPSVRYRSEDPQQFYWQIGAFQIKADDLVQLHGNQLSFDNRDNYLLIGEVALLEDSYDQVGKAALGVWTYNVLFNQMGKQDARVGSGAYLLWDRPLSDQVSYFFRYGAAMVENGGIGLCNSLGLNFKGIARRENDHFGAALTTVDYREYIVEFTYRYFVHRGLSLQPDFQYVRMPLYSDIPYAFVGTLRLEMKF